MTESRYLDPEDEAFNEIERRSVVKKEAVKAAVEKPKRTWVGLTDEEIEIIYADCNVWDKFEYERMLEAKLKEKNNG